ncbi:MAG: SIR2 family protein [Clostridiales bacterium]|nr:SIR2 family protein [Clostridiales bacterium]
MGRFGFWITEETELPGEILQSIEEDRLVLFVGAGVSMASPSYLPSFEDLVKQICQNTNHSGFLTPGRKKLNKREKDSLGLDGILGIIKDSMGDVGNTLHNEIFNILKTAFEENRINNTHKAIVDLANASPTVRIVTTNQDRLLECDLLYASYEKPLVYDAPALPDGSDFRGIVNLHGSISIPEKMIFSDSDFGEAYLTKQYCARFLTELFSKFTVLFVGYSHDDPLMKYHARGLGECERFILTHDISNPKWNTLGIRTIHYRKTHKPDVHSEVPRILYAISEYIKMSPGDKRNKLKSIAIAGPQDFLNNEMSLIREVLLDTSDDTYESLKYFLDNANDYKWYDFLENDDVLRDHNIIQAVFGVDAYDARTNIVTEWFLKVCFCIGDEEAVSFGFGKLSRTHHKWNEGFITNVISIIADGQISQVASEKLCLLCAGRLRGFSNKLELAYYLEKLSIRSHWSLVKAILEELAFPIPKLEKSWRFHSDGGYDQFDIVPYTPAGDETMVDWYLKEWWNKRDVSYIDCYEEIVACFSQNLEKMLNYFGIEQ